MDSNQSGGTFLGLVVMLSCCNVIMACFNLHLAVCDVRCLRFTGIQEKCMEDQKLHEHRLLVLCEVFKKNTKGAWNIKKLPEHRLLVLCQVFKDLSRACEVKVDLKLSMIF